MTQKTRTDLDFATLEKTGWSEADTAADYARTFAKASDFAVPVLVVAGGSDTLAAWEDAGEGAVVDATRLRLVRFGEIELGKEFVVQRYEHAACVAAELPEFGRPGWCVDRSDDAFTIACKVE